MYTYDVISESVRNPHQLASELTRRSNEGWEVVQIVFDGAAWFHAFIRHSGNVSVSPHAGMSADQLKANVAAPAAIEVAPGGVAVADAYRLLIHHRPPQEEDQHDDKSQQGDYHV